MMSILEMFVMNLLSEIIRMAGAGVEASSGCSCGQRFNLISGVASAGMHHVKSPEHKAREAKQGGGK